MKNVRTPGDAGQSTDPSIDSSATKPEEGDLIAEIEASDARVIASLPRAEQAAHYREMITSLNRAVAAAKKLDPMPDGEVEPEPEEEDDEDGPVTDPMGPSGASLAFLSNGRVALSVAHVEGADLDGYERWEGIILSFEQADEVLEGLSDAADDVAANVGGSIRWRKDEPEGSGGDAEG